MKLEKIKELFENVSQQSKEELILGNIIRCKEIIIQNPYVNQEIKFGKTQDFIQLFESLSDIKLSNTNMFVDNENILDVKDFHNNIFAYLGNVKKLLESTRHDVSMLFENENIVDFQLNIQDLLGKLEKVNDFDKLETLNDSILKTKLFAKQPIIINGVNLFEVEKIKEVLNFRKLIGILYNKSDRHLVFVGDGKMIYYDIRTDEIDEVRSLDYVENFKFTESNFVEEFKNNVSNNIVIIYKDTSDKKFLDNLYHDSLRLQEIARLQNEKVSKQKNLQFFK